MKKIYLGLSGLLAVHLLLLTSFRFTAWPEMFSFAYLINKGYLIYKDFHHAYQPLLPIILAFFYKTFGISILVLKLVSWGIILFSDLLIFAISLKLFGRKVIALLPLAIFVALQPAFDGNMLWYDTAILPTFLGATLIFLYWLGNRERKYLFLSGVLLSVTLLIKQQSVLLVLAFLIFMIYKKATLKDYFSLFIGGIIPVILVYSWLASIGVFRDYIFWTFTLPLKWLPKVPGYKTLPSKTDIVALAFLVLPITNIFRSKLYTKKYELKLLLFLLFATFLQAFPRFSFFHLQAWLVIFSLIIAVGFESMKRVRPLFSFPILFVGLMLWVNKLPEFGQAVRFYGQEEIKLAEFIQKNSNISDKIYLLGPHSLTYVLSERTPPKPWIENYVWHFEIPGMEEKLLQGFSLSPPKIIIWSEPRPGPWYDLVTYQPEKVTDWIRTNYKKGEEVESGVFVWYKN